MTLNGNNMLADKEIEHLKSYIKKIKPTLGGKLLFHALPFRKKLVLHNLRLVFSNFLTEDERIKLAKGFYSHIFTTIKESILLRFMTTQQIKSRAVVIGEKYLAALGQNKIKGALVITGHFGNWELAPIAGILNFTEFSKDFYFIRKTQSIKLLEKIFFNRFYKVGLGVIPKKNSLTEVYNKLESEQVIIMVMDQYAKGKEGLPVEFFGIKTNTYRTVAMIAKDTGVPVIPARAYRRQDGKHVLEFLPPLSWQPHEDPYEEIKINTRNYNQALEKLILEYPDQWLWMYKRWKEIKINA